MNRITFIYNHEKKEGYYICNSSEEGFVWVEDRTESVYRIHRDDMTVLTFLKEVKPSKLTWAD